MKYLPIIIIIFILFLIPLYGIWKYCKCIKFDFISKILTNAIWNCFKKQGNKACFSSLIIKKTALFLNSQKRKDLLTLVSAIKNSDFKSLLKKMGEQKSFQLKADFETLLWGKIHLHSSVETKAWFLLQKEDFVKAQRLLTNQKDNHQPYIKALIAYCNGGLQLQEGDLLSASENFALAAAIFKKLKMPFEEAKCYIMNGTIYRICGLFDVARIMFMTAQKIFANEKASVYEAEINGNLGMLMVSQNLFDEADEYFNEAADIFLKNNNSQGFAEILNQESLTLLIQKNNKKAEEKACEALEIHRKIKNSQGEAFSLELLAHNAVAQKKWKKAIQLSSEAEKLYIKNKNIAALREVLFLQARGMFETNTLQKSEKLLRQIIDDSKKKSSAFHVANAYNLLGMIYLKKGDLQRAKGIFQQSLEHELKDDRTDGAAIDYANIAMIDYMRGQKLQSEKTFAKALEYAKTFEEGELFELIKKIQAQH